MSRSSLLLHILLKLGKELLIECRVHHLFEFLNLCTILSESYKYSVFIRPFEISKRRVSTRSCIEGRLVPGSIVHGFVDINLRGG